MADQVDSEEKVVPSDVIDPGELPPLRYKDLPEPIGWKQMIGPSILLVRELKPFFLNMRKIRCKVRLENGP